MLSAQLFKLTSTKLFVILFGCVFILFLLIIDNINNCPPPIDKSSLDIMTEDSYLSMLFNTVKHTWNDYGKHRPYWGVINRDEYSTPNITDDDLLDFLITGVTIVNKSLDSIRKYNVTLNYNRALDFGCGACRLSLSLASYFDIVYSMDISEFYLNECSNNAKKFEMNNIVPMINDGSVNLHGIKVDFIFSLITIQHNPPEIQQYTIKRLLQLLNPKGVAYLHVVYGVKNRSAHDVDGQVEKAKTQVKIQMHYTPIELIEYIVREQNCKLVASWDKETVKSRASDEK
eukprot:470726_1